MTDDVYRERARLVANLAARYPSHMGFTDPDEPEWAVVVIETPEGQMSWHVAPADQGLFNLVRRTKPTDKPWDGHSTPEKYERLARLTRHEHHVSRETFTDHSPEGVAVWMDHLGRVAFDAYREHVGGVTYNGLPIPTWEEIAPETREAWTWSAMATIARHVTAVKEG